MVDRFERQLDLPLEPRKYLDELSLRELEVLHGRSLGLEANSIGAELHISRHTIRAHLRNISKRVGQGDGEYVGMVAMVAALEVGLIPREGIVTGTISDLSAREREVLTLMAEGQSNRVIAGFLEVSVHTVGAHISSINLKLHSKNRFQAVAVGVVVGLINPKPQI